LDLYCENEKTISSGVALGGTIIQAKKSVNEASCTSYSNKMSLETDHCRLFMYLDEKMKEAKCKGENKCKVELDKNKIYQNCTKNILFDTLYFVYSCYGKNLKKKNPKFFWFTIMID